MAEDDYEDDPVEPSPRDLRVQLKDALARASDADKLREQVQRLERDGVIRDAGLTLNDLQRKALQAAHDGNWEAASLKQTAVELGFAQAEQPLADPTLSQVDQISNAAAGTDAPTEPGLAERDAKLRAATSEKEFDAIMREYGVKFAE